MSLDVTFVLIKPDGVERGLVGEILSRFERVGLEILAIKKLIATKRRLREFFPEGEAKMRWIMNMGEKCGQDFQTNGNAQKLSKKELEPVRLGTRIAHLNLQYLSRGPVVALVLRGVKAVELVRKIVGHTLPAKAAPGTIRGDFSGMTGDYALLIGKSCENLIHAADSCGSAYREMAAFFSRREIDSFLN